MDKAIIKIYLQFIFYFLIFGIIVAVITSILNLNNKFSDINKIIYDKATENISCKQEKIKKYIANIKNDINSLESNQLLQDFLEKNNPENLQNLQNLMLHIANSTKEYFQVRFISHTGQEIIRVDKDKNSAKSFLVKKSQLQNKSHRYYFKETIKLPPNAFWFSKLDLNMENKKIEYPLTPTLRVAKPIYQNNRQKGIIIFNINMHYLIKELLRSAYFNIFLIDKDGYILVNKNKNYCWSRYLNSGYTFNKLFPHAKQVLEVKNFDDDKFHAVSLEHLFQNNENIQMVLQTDKKFVEQLIDNNYKVTYYLALTILLISIPLGMIIAIQPSHTQKRLQEVIFEKNRYLDIIDKYVLTLSTDLQGNITSVSSALSDISKYSKKELLGKHISIFKSGLMPESHYKNLWSTISKGKVWSGEILNKTKDGKHYWIEMDILPQFNNDNKLTAYTSISNNITNRKALEKLSENDSLTQIYNRYKIDQILQNEINRSLRSKEYFSIILIDIDHFKSVNDTYGHQVGDSVLVEFANILKSNIRSTDMVGRWGGEEFIIICLDTDIHGAVQLAESIRKKIYTFHFTKIKNASASFGVAVFSYNDTQTTLIDKADKALYEAKNDGRDCVKY